MNTQMQGSLRGTREHVGLGTFEYEGAWRAARPDSIWRFTWAAVVTKAGHPFQWFFESSGEHIQGSALATEPAVKKRLAELIDGLTEWPPAGSQVGDRDGATK